MNYVLAVDGGGTKTHVVCATLSGEKVGEGVSGPTSLTATSVGAASFNLKEAVRQATEKCEPNAQYQALVMGLAGMDTPAEEQVARETFLQTLSHLSIASFQLVNDIVIALEGGTDEVNAVALISGTGSNCYGRNQEQMTAKAGGMDYLLTDQGSGYAIGLEVLKSVVKSYDQRGPKTELEQYVCEHFRIQSIGELKTKVYQPPLTKTEVAELAQLCLRAYDQGDEVAGRIFATSVDELFAMAATVLRRLNLLDKPATCVLAGSITKLSCVQEPLSKKLKELNPQLKIEVPAHPPVEGALELALKAASSH
jgi:N-acetylglucosamine kinase-like BadF-type ATPase